MMAKIIDGKARAAEVRSEIKKGVEALKKKWGITPKLSVVLVGDNPASQVYVRNKERGCAEVGMLSETIKLSDGTKQAELEKIVAGLNEDRSVHGILVQLPLPKGLNEARMIAAVSPEKDVDGLHPLNMGLLLKGEGAKMLACTAAGIIDLIKTTGVEIKGKEAVVVGRSSIVGKPAAILLLQEHATVTICHSRTIDLPSVIKRADILVAAVGVPGLVKGEMVKEGAIVIDVGTNKVDGKWVGDVVFDEVIQKAGYITPVPGGVGPMTIAMLLKNTLLAAELAAAKKP